MVERPRRFETATFPEEPSRAAGTRTGQNRTDEARSPGADDIRNRTVAGLASEIAWGGGTLRPVHRPSETGSRKRKPKSHFESPS